MYLLVKLKEHVPNSGHEVNTHWLTGECGVEEERKEAWDSCAVWEEGGPELMPLKARVAS